MEQAAFSGSRNNQEALAPAARSRSSIVRIDSIYIDINASEQSTSQECEHFTIRGLVSKFREKNGEVCLPFSVDVDGSSDYLPPLQVPNYKWWHCQNCLSKIDAAGTSKDTEKISVSQCSQSKSKCSYSHKSLENIVAHLSTKFNQLSHLGTLQDGLSQQDGKFTSKIIPETQIYDPVLDLNSRRRAENESHSAETGIVANRQTVADVDKQKKRLLTPSTKTSKFAALNGVRHKDKHAAEIEQMRQHGDELGGICRRRTRRIRLLTEIGDDGNTAQPIENQGILTTEFQSPQALSNGHGSWSQERNDRFQEQEVYPQIQNADNLVGRGERRQAQDLDSAFANTETYTTPGNTFDGAISLQAEKMQFYSNQRAYAHLENHHDSGFFPGSLAPEPVPNRGKITNFDSFKLPEPLDLSVSQSFLGRSTNYDESMHQGANIVASAIICSDKNKDIVQNSLQTQSLQDEYSRKGLHHFPDRCNDTRRSIVDLVCTKNGTPRNAMDTQYIRESSRPCNTYGEKNIWQGTNGISSQKRPSHGPNTANKKLKHSPITEGDPLVMQKSESLGRNRNDKLVGVDEHPEVTLRKFRANMMQEVATSDDIPMEIVELMAKNQYERRLHEIADGNTLLLSGSNLKNTVVDATNVVHNGAPCVPNGLATAKQNSGVANRMPSGHPMQRHSAEGTGGSDSSCQPEQAKVLQYLAMASSRNGFLQDSRYGIYNIGREHGVSPRAHALYETWQPASQQRNTAGRVWRMIPPNNPVHMPNALQGNTCLSKMPYAKYDSRGHIVKTVSPNAADIGNEVNNIRSEVSHVSFPIRVDTQSQLMQSPNSYGSDAIPAMHLLSLMDAGMQSSAPSDATGNKKTFDMPFSNDHLAKELSEFSLGVGKLSQKSNQPSPTGNCNKNHVTDASCQRSPPVPLFGSVVPSLHIDVGNKKVTYPLSQYQDRSHMKRDAAGSTILNENEARNYYNSRLAISGAGTVQKPVPVHGSLYHTHGPSYSLPGSSRSNMHGNFGKYRTLVAGDPSGTIRRSPDAGLCCLNRNPADFTIPGPGNEYMIGPKDLKFRDRAGPSSVSRQVYTNTLKQQRIVDSTSSKQPPTARHQVFLS